MGGRWRLASNQAAALLVIALGASAVSATGGFAEPPAGSTDCRSSAQPHATIANMATTPARLISLFSLPTISFLIRRPARLRHEPLDVTFKHEAAGRAQRLRGRGTFRSRGGRRVYKHRPPDRIRQTRAPPPQEPPDFLWCVSSDSFLRVPQRLPSHRRQMMLLAIRDVALPHHEDDLQPFRSQGPQRPAMPVTPRAL